MFCGIASVPQKNKEHLIPYYHLKLLVLCSLDYVLPFCMDGKASKKGSTKNFLCAITWMTTIFKQMTCSCALQNLYFLFYIHTFSWCLCFSREKKASPSCEIVYSFRNLCFWKPQTNIWKSITYMNLNSE